MDDVGILRNLQAQDSFTMILAELSDIDLQMSSYIQFSNSRNIFWPSIMCQIVRQVLEMQKWIEH